MHLEAVRDLPLLWSQVRWSEAVQHIRGPFNNFQFVTPAQAGVRWYQNLWILAFAGMTFLEVTIRVTSMFEGKYEVSEISIRSDLQRI